MRHLFSRSLVMFVLILALTLILPLLSLKLFDSAEPLPAAYCVPVNKTAEAERLCALFDSIGLITFDDKELLAREIAAGHLSMGVIIPDDFSHCLACGETEDILILLEGQSSIFGELEITEITAALFQVAAPYITLDSLNASGFSFDRKDVFSEYYGMLADGLLFSFEQQTAEGKDVEMTGRLNLFCMVLGLILWVGMLLGICIPVTGRVRSLIPSIGKERAWKKLGIPAFLCAFALLFTAALAVCLASGYTALIMPSLLVMTLMGIVGLVLCLCFPGGHVCTVVCVFLAALAPALCPGLYDISLVVPVIERIRVICPVYWLWLL